VEPQRAPPLLHAVQQLPVIARRPFVRLTSKTLRDRTSDKALTLLFGRDFLDILAAGKSRCAPSARAAPYCDGISVHLGVSGLGLDERRHVRGWRLIGPSEIGAIACDRLHWPTITTIKQLARRAEADCLVGGTWAVYAGQLSADAMSRAPYMP
jgi:hypothetical protein